MNPTDKNEVINIINNFNMNSNEYNFFMNPTDKNEIINIINNFNMNKST